LRGDMPIFSGIYKKKRLCVLLHPKSLTLFEILCVIFQEKV
jgi:hypothetical protein